MSDAEDNGIKPSMYRPRIVDALIERYMRIFGAVEIAGTKWCGKTWSARAHAASITYVDRDSNLAAAKADPALMLLGERPHIIDEWQLAPAIWDEVRRHVDDESERKGQWLLTGSSTPLWNETPKHSGTHDRHLQSATFSDRNAGRKGQTSGSHEIRTAPRRRRTRTRERLGTTRYTL